MAFHMPARKEHTSSVCPLGRPLTSKRKDEQKRKIDWKEKDDDRYDSNSKETYV